MTRSRFIGGLAIAFVCVALAALVVWKTASPDTCAHYIACAKASPAGRATLVVRFYTFVVGFAFGMALMNEKRRKQRVNFNLYAAAALIPSAAADMAISIVNPDHVYRNLVDDIASDTFLLLVGIWLYKPYWQRKRKEQRGK